jgi:hypothetical protein
LETQRVYGSDRRKVIEYLNVFINSKVFIDTPEGLIYKEQTHAKDFDNIFHAK